MKYVIGKNSVNDHYVVSVFDEVVTHAHIAKAMMFDRVRLRSAGFVYIYKGISGSVVTIGTEVSESLNLGPKKGDQLVLELFLRDGLSGLDLANMIAHHEIQARKSHA